MSASSSSADGIVSFGPSFPDLCKGGQTGNGHMCVQSLVESFSFVMGSGFLSNRSRKEFPDTGLSIVEGLAIITVGLFCSTRSCDVPVCCSATGRLELRYQPVISIAAAQETAAIFWKFVEICRIRFSSQPAFATQLLLPRSVLKPMGVLAAAQSQGQAGANTSIWWRGSGKLCSPSSGRYEG